MDAEKEEQQFSQDVETSAQGKLLNEENRVLDESSKNSAASLITPKFYRTETNPITSLSDKSSIGLKRNDSVAELTDAVLSGIAGVGLDERSASWKEGLFSL